MNSTCSSTLPDRANADASINVTELLLQRYQDSPKDDWDRLYKCWGYDDCGDCHRSDGFCGWCALTSTCLPLPTDMMSRAIPLLSPIRHKFLCPQVGERFELRTAGLGCQVSTITFLTSIVTIISTLFGVVVLFFLLQCAKWVGLSLRARRGGYVVFPIDYEQLEGDIWVRKPESWGKWWRRLMGEQKESGIVEIDEGTPERGWVWWSQRKHGDGRSARAPLLGNSE